MSTPLDDSHFVPSAKRTSRRRAFSVKCQLSTVTLPEKEQWGILTRKDSKLEAKESVSPEDLLNVPLIMTKRELVKGRLADWFGDYYDQIEVAATYNLIINAAFMVQNNVGSALGFRFTDILGGLCYVPLSPNLETGSVLVWKKHQIFSPAASHFIQHVKNALKAF